MFAITMDQQGSRTGPDLVPALVEHINGYLAGRTGVVLPFDRTVGDEVQGLLDDAGTVLDLVLDILRQGGWSIGIGIGPVDHPLPSTSREAAGPAYVAARTAVDRAKYKNAPLPIAVEGPVRDTARDAEAVVRLLGAVVARRSDKAWEAIDTLAAVGGSQKNAARALRVSEQAVSARLRAASWAEEQAARPVAARLLREADS